MEKVFQIYIRTTPERLWAAIVAGGPRAYAFGTAIATDWKRGSRYEMSGPGGNGLWAKGEILEIDPPRRLVETSTMLWSDDVKAEGRSRITWEIVQQGEFCCLTVTHDQLREGANDELYGGWPMILSSLKSLLETGKALQFSHPGPKRRHPEHRRLTPARRSLRSSGWP